MAALSEAVVALVPGIYRAFPGSTIFSFPTRDRPAFVYKTRGKPGRALGEERWENAPDMRDASLPRPVILGFSGHLTQRFL